MTEPGIVYNRTGDLRVRIVGGVTSLSDMGKMPASALASASQSLNFSIKSPASALASSYFLSVASA